MLRAEEVLDQYRHKGHLTPEVAYDLVLTLTDSKQEAIKAKSTVTLNNMPPI